MADQEKITTRLEVDITNFRKGLSDASRAIRMANSEFDAATAGMDKWSDSSEGLAAKLKQLSKVMSAQEAALEVLRAEYDRVAKEQGEGSKSAQELQIKINKQQATIKKTKAQMEKYSKALDENENSAEDNSKATGSMSDAMGKAATAAGNLARNLATVAGKTLVNGLKALAAASGALVTAFLASGEASKEYIAEMAKLNAAYEASGHSAETATKTYKTLQGVIGETDQAVEAAQQIALLADSEKEAAAWAELGAGVVGRFGDALQPETFFEAANETLKLGTATGAYTQMLEGCGYSVDEFNAGLAACKTEGEKNAYMLKVTQAALGEAGAAFMEANAAVIESNQANDNWQQTMAKVGEVALPITSAFKNIGAAVLQDMLPGIKQLGEAFRGLLDGSEGAAEKMGNAVAGLLQQIGQKLVSALPTILTAGGQVVVSLVQGIIAAAPQLLAAAGQLVQQFRAALPQLLQTGGEMIASLLDGIVSNLPNMLQGAVSAIGSFVSGLQQNLPGILAKGAELIGKLGEGIRTSLPGLISQALDIVMNFATTLYDAAPQLIETGFDLLQNLVQGIINSIPDLLAKVPEIISKFANIINDNFPTILAKGAQLLWQIIKGILSAIPALIKNIPKIITAIVDVWEAFNWLNLGKKAITALKDGVLKMVGAVKNAGHTIANNISSVIQQLPSKLLNLGKTAITNFKNGIVSMVSSVAGAGRSVLSSIVSIITSLPGKLLQLGSSAISGLGNAIASGIGTVRAKASSIVSSVVSVIQGLPSKMLNIGKNLVRGLWNGISDMTGWVIGKIQSFGQSVLSGIKSFFGINSPSKVMADEVGKWLPAGMAEGIEANTRSAVRAMSDMAKTALGAANAELSGATLNAHVSGNPARTGNPAAGAVYNYTQIINSPKPVNRLEIYRQTKNQLRFATATART